MLGVARQLGAVGVFAVPAEFGVAFVAHDDGAELPRPRHGSDELRDAEDATVGIARTVDPDELGGLGPFDRIIAREDRCPGERGTHGVGGVGEGRLHDDVALPEPEPQRQAGDEFLRADGRQDVGHREVVDPAPPGEPCDDRLAKRRSPRRERVGVRVRRRGERLADDRGRRVDG
jgi:hypothetical protein